MVASAALAKRLPKGNVDLKMFCFVFLSLINRLFVCSSSADQDLGLHEPVRGPSVQPNETEMVSRHSDLPI
jgi:hypothetical protein